MAERSIVVRLRAEVADYKRQMAEAARETNRIPESAARAETALGRMVQSARYNREAWDRAGRTLTAFGTATVAALGASAKAAIDWESAWTGVLKTVDGTDSQLAELEDDLRQMARTLPATHQEIAAVAEAAGQLGIQTPNVAAFTRTMIDLGETTNLSAQDAATGLARFANVMGTSQQDFDRLGSVIVGLGNNFATTEAEILAMAQRLSSAGRVVGLTESDVLALATAMSSVGIEAEAGGSAVSRVMMKIASAVDDGGDDLANFARVAGMTSEDFAAKWRGAPVDALLAVVGGLAQMTQTGQGTFGMLEELGLTDIRVTNAMLSLANATDLTRNAVAMASQEWERNTALAAEAEKRYGTAASQMRVAWNNVTDAAIEFGEVFLPVIVEASQAVAGFAQWVGGLPEPIKATVGVMGGLVGVTSLAAGGFLLLFPRVMDTIAAFRTLHDMNPRLVSGLGRVARAAGTVTAAVAGAVAIGTAVKSIVDSAQGIDRTAAGVEALTNRLIDANAVGQIYEATIGDLVESGAAASWAFDDMASAVERVANQNWADRFFGGIGLDADGISDMTRRFEELGQTLAGLAGSDLPSAQRLFRAMWEEAGGTAEAGRDLLKIMPAYRDQLYAIATGQGVVLDETTLLNAATGELALVSDDAAGSAEGLAGAVAEVDPAVQAATEALAEWRAMVAEADASFIDIAGAYQSVIDKNIELAQATADSTRSSKDSWEDYYDGFTVTSAEYIASLEEQVRAQQTWEENILAIAARVRDGLTGEMRTAAEQMIDELIALGPEGAAQVQLLRDMSEPEFVRVVDLWRQKGTDAVSEFVSQVESYRQPEIDVTANLTPAESQMRDFVNRQWSARVRFDFSAGSGLTPRVVHLGMAGGGPVPGVAPHPRADNVLARLTSGEYVHQVPAVNYWGTRFMDAVNRMDRAAVASSVAGYAHGGQVGVPASAPVPVVYAPGAPGRSAPLVGQMVVNEVTDGIGTAHTVLRYVESLGV